MIDLGTCLLAALAAAAAVVPLGRLWRPAARQPAPAVVDHPCQERPTPASTTAWADLLDTVARHVRGGFSLSVAFDQALATHPIAGQAVAPGQSFQRVLRATTRDPDESTVVHSLAVAHSFGGAVSSGLQAAVSVLRERAAVRADIAVHSAQARLSARVLTAVPVVFASWSLVGSRSFRGAVATPAGAVAMLLGAVLNMAGWVWMRRTVARAGR